MCFWPTAVWLRVHWVKRHTRESGWGRYTGETRGVTCSCVATKYFVIAKGCLGVGEGVYPWRIGRDLYPFPLIFHSREDLGERLKGFCGVQGQFKVSFWALWLAQFHHGVTRAWITHDCQAQLAAWKSCLFHCNIWKETYFFLETSGLVLPPPPSNSIIKCSYRERCVSAWSHVITQDLTMKFEMLWS